jgi:hypothetical protein
LQRIEAADLQEARNELRRHLGHGDGTSLRYIAAILRAAKYQVTYDESIYGSSAPVRNIDPVIPEPYASRLKGVLEFHDLASAEQSVLRFDAIYREYQGTSDQIGIRWVRALVKKGKQRAWGLALNRSVRVQKRQEKQEIANWFQVWLETPDLFADWLALRKSSAEFRQLFGGGDTLP